MKRTTTTDVSPEQLEALISLAHTADMWQQHGSDTELHDELSEQENLLRPLMDMRDAELRQRTHFLANGGRP